LFIGLWQENDQYKVTFLPTEVKVGLNGSSTMKKADVQVEKTYSVFEKELINSNDFKSLFYLDFFMKLFFANVAKMYSNNDMTKEEYNKLLSVKDSVIQGNLEIDNSLTDFYNNKFVFSLKAENNNRLIKITDKYAMVEVPEGDAFVFSGVKTDDVISVVQNNEFGFDKDRLLSQLDNNDSSDVTSTDYRQPTQFVVDRDDDKEETLNNFNNEINENTDSSEKSFKLDNHTDDLDDAEVVVEKKPESNIEKENRRILLGSIEGKSNKDYWEYDNSQLANRHMLITGKSGQGKTYFIQTLLLEFAKNKIDSLVIDYTDSYLPGQLDEILEENAAVHQHIVKQEKLPINPFKKSEYSIGKYHELETTEEVVSRVAEVMDFVFNLGPQQKAHLITIMNDGITRNSKYTFALLKEELLDSDDMSLYGRIQPLLDNDPFSYSNSDFDWSEYFGQTGQVNILQLSRFTKTVQNAMIEFILWDLFNYSQMNTDKHLIYPVFLDEVQNLNFNSDAPTLKILREGRKFGWSGIFATQSLSSIKGEIDAIYNTAEQVHFLPPENQIKVIAKTLSSDRRFQNDYEQQLSNLKKGQCIVNGPLMSYDGNLVKNINVVNIDSLGDRL